MPTDEFDPLVPDDGEWAPINPVPVPPTLVSTIPAGAITDDQLAPGISPLKIAGIGMKVYGANAQVVSNNTNEPGEYDTTVFNQGFPPLASNVLTVPYTSVYLLSAVADWDNNTDSTARNLRLQVNGSDIERVQIAALSGGPTTVVATAVRLLTAGDTVGTELRQSSGGDLEANGGEEFRSLTAVLLFSI